MLASKVQHIEFAQTERAIDSCVAAFRHDPVMAFLQPDDAKREQFLNWFAAKVLRFGSLYGHVYCDQQARGVAVWLGPGETNMTMWRMFRAGFLTLPFKWGMGMMSRFNALDSKLKKIHKQATPGQHWYLLLVGVSPEHQGQGIGSSLIKKGTDQADSRKLPCYLETETEENVAYYQKRGFEVVGEHKFSDSLTMWGMRRQPR